MGNTVGGASGSPNPAAVGYVPTGDEVVGTPAPPPSAPPPSGTGAPRDGFDGTSGRRATDPAPANGLASPAPRRLQDIAANAGDTAATGSDRGGIRSAGDFFMAILEFFAEVFTLGGFDSRLFNDYDSGDRARIAEGGRAFARNAYNNGNGTQLDQFIVRSGTPPVPQMTGTPPLVQVTPRLREAVEAEVRQAFTNSDGNLTISNQALRIRTDAMIRGIREEMTARQSGHTTNSSGAAVVPGAAGSDPVGNATFTRTDAPGDTRTQEPGPRGALSLTTFTDATALTNYIEGSLGNGDRLRRGPTDESGRPGLDGKRDFNLSGGLAGATGERLQAIHDQAEATGWRFTSGPLDGTNLSEIVPTAAETRQIREKFAAMNAAIQSGDYETATRLASELGLPMSEAAMIGSDTAMSAQQYKTALALGLMSIPAERDGTPTGGPTWRDSLGETHRTTYYDRDGNLVTNRRGEPLERNERHFLIPSPLTSAFNGPANFAALMNDMERVGVENLQSPPSQANILQYLDHVRDMHRTDSPADQQTALLEANQRLMSGLQVHYRGASGVDPQYGRHGANEGTFVVTGARGDPPRGGTIVTSDQAPFNGGPVRFPLPSTMSEADQRTFLGLGADAAIPASGEDQFQAYRRGQGRAGRGMTFFEARDQSPDSFGDVSTQPNGNARGVYAHGFESDCEGMAAFRLRTLPPGFEPVGVVTGGPRSGSIGHAVSLFRGPDGSIYLSSNGQEPRRVEDRNGDGRIDGDEMQRAVLTEFARIYHRGLGQSGSLAVSDPENMTSDDFQRVQEYFQFGIGTPGTPPTDVTSREDVLNWQATHMMQDAGEAQILRAHVGGMPDPNWDALAPPPPRS